MAVTTDDEKLAVMVLNNPLAPNVVLNETAPFSQGDKQQLLWGYPGVLWQPPVAVEPSGQGWRRGRRR